MNFLNNIYINLLIELLVNENNKTANINYINWEIDISNQKDHDDKLEIIRTNDSYLDWFIDNAVLNEHQVILETPMHEQTITSLEKENFTTYSNFEKFKRNNQDREESEKDDIKKVSRIILNNAPVLLKSIVDLLVRQKVQGTFKFSWINFLMIYLQISIQKKNQSMMKI